MKNLIVLTGAGISAESGLKTFRDSGGLWENYDVMEVASIEGWYRNPDLVLRFYNDRRKQMMDAQPNEGHKTLAALEKHFNVRIITQNIDDLHEQAGSSKVLHLHGELKKARSTVDPALIYEISGTELNRGDLCERGSQLRPHVVWFGEEVPAMEDAIGLVETADIFAVIGTSLNVYPAASLIQYAPREIPLFLIDPNEVRISSSRNITFIREKAGRGVSIMASTLLKNYANPDS
ncbi:MAG: NAD-dependent deacylase [Bacteroidales bacterium]